MITILRKKNFINYTSWKYCNTKLSMIWDLVIFLLVRVQVSVRKLVTTAEELTATFWPASIIEITTGYMVMRSSKLALFIRRYFDGYAVHS